MPGLKDFQQLQKMAALVRSVAQDAAILLPKEGFAIGGKYDGRLGKITGAIPDEKAGLLIGFYVYKAPKRKDASVNREILNTDGESRRYRRLDEIEFIWQKEMVV